MKYSDPKRLAFLVSLIIAFICSAIFIILGIIYNHILWLYMVSTAIVVFIFSYFIYLYTVQKFIYEKIKLIYKTIQNSRYTGID